MAVSLGSNIYSLRAQRSLNVASSRLFEALTRLSSGSRINRASDDAAGLSIADSLKARRILAGAAIRNVSDGLSALHIMDGALNEQRAIITRMYELAEQSANGTYSNQQRRALVTEYNALAAESGRIGNTTTFNNLRLLRGLHPDGVSALGLQVGRDGSANSHLGVSGVDTAVLSGTFRVGNTNATPFADSWTFDEIESKFGDRILRATVTDNTGKSREIFLAAGTQTTFDGIDYALSFRVFQRVSDTGGLGAQTAAGASGDVTSATDDLVYAGAWTLSFNGNTGRFAFATTTALNLSFDGGSATGQLVLDFTGLLFSRSTNSSVNGSTALEASGIETESNARTALEVLSRRLAELSQFAGEIGATQSRLDSALSVLKAARENEAAAESRIRDADIAAESATLTSATILQQISAAVLAQANQAPSLVLSLLGATRQQ